MFLRVRFEGGNLGFSRLTRLAKRMQVAMLVGPPLPDGSYPTVSHVTGAGFVGHLVLRRTLVQRYGARVHVRSEGSRLVVAIAMPATSLDSWRLRALSHLRAGFAPPFVQVQGGEVTMHAAPLAGTDVKATARQLAEEGFDCSLEPFLDITPWAGLRQELAHIAFLPEGPVQE